MMEYKSSIESVVIVGGGFQGYLIALALRGFLGTAVKVAVVEKPVSVKSQPMILSGRYLRELHREIKVDESEFLRLTHAQPLLGTLIERSDINGEALQKPGFFYCDAEYGFFLKGKRFNKLLHQFRKTNPGCELDNFCLQAVIARANRFTSGSSDPKSMLSMVSHDYALEASDFSRFLESYSEQSDIQIVRVDSLDVETDQNGIRALHAKNNKVTADLFIDCSSEGLMSNRLFPNKKSLANYLPSLSFSTQQQISAAPKPYAVMTIGDESIVTAFDFAGNLVANTWVLGGDRVPDVREILWVGNCVSMGRDALNITGGIADDLQLLHLDISRLRNYWPDALTLSACRDAYNKVGQQELKQLLDVANLFFASIFTHLNFTEHNIQRLNLFRDVGRIPGFEREPRTTDQWIVLLHALGYREFGFEEDICQDDNWISRELNGMLKTFADIAASVPAYKDTLRR